MQTEIAPEFAGTAEGAEAEAILRKCVHCGFCTATCPTYQILGDELDGPRGRIYLIKQVLEGHAPTRATQIHLDRCLTCRNCETTCPSGVQYGNLVEIGRRIVDERVARPADERALRWTLKEGLTSSAFAPAMKVGRAVRSFLPAALKAKVPANADPGAHRWPRREHPRKVLLLLGCVQPAMMPNINSATARVLDAAGIQTLVADEAGCCGAIRLHLSDREGALEHMRRNIDAWWPMVASGAVEAIVMNASGCGVTVKEYGHSLAHDPEYAAKAGRIADLTRDLSELLPELVETLRPRLARSRPEGRRADHAPRPERRSGRIAFHSPCTLQHGQSLRGGVEETLRALGFEIEVARTEAHLCCGSAGTYSVLQPEMAYALRDRKLGHLAELEPTTIVSANIGCIQHLQSGTRTPVRHWIEVLDEALAA
jgi:glycolate dehydrogenase iron-sulfur subunit